MSNNRIEKVTAAIAFIETHLTEKLDLDAVASAVHYSKYHQPSAHLGAATSALQRCELDGAKQKLPFYL